MVRQDAGQGNIKQRAIDASCDAIRERYRHVGSLVNQMAVHSDAVEIMALAIECITIRRHSETDEPPTWRMGQAVRRLLDADYQTAEAQ